METGIAPTQIIKVSHRNTYLPQTFRAMWNVSIAKQVVQQLHNILNLLVQIPGPPEIQMQ